jgi:hypothetical protein
MKRFHLIFGVLLFIAFVLTGQYMDRYLAHLRETPDLPRMLYRSRHIYILLAGMINLGIGAYFRMGQERWQKVLQLVGSLLITVASVLFVVAFAMEPPRESFYVPYSRRAIYWIFTGTALHAISGVRRRANEDKQRT